MSNFFKCGLCLRMGLLGLAIASSACSAFMTFKPTSCNGCMSNESPSFHYSSSYNNAASVLSFSPSQGQKRGGEHKKMSQLQMVDIDSLIMGSGSLSLAVEASSSPLVTQDDIFTAFRVATFLPQVFWFLLILLPNAAITKRIMGGYEVIGLLSLVHLFIVIGSLYQKDGAAPIELFSNVFDFAQTAQENQAAMTSMFTYPNFVSEEWSHVLTWDLFVGRWIWLDGIRRDIFTIHSVILCNLIGPPGFLLHLLTCAITGKELPGNEAISQNDDN